MSGRTARFLLVGAANTLGSYVIFFVLGLFLPAWLAYTIAFAAGLAWTSLASSRLVFRVRYDWRRAVLFVAVYLVVFGLGQVVIHLISPRNPVELLITSAVVLAVTTPLAFIGGHLIFRPQAGQTLPTTTKDSSP